MEDGEAYHTVFPSLLSLSSIHRTMSVHATCTIPSRLTYCLRNLTMRAKFAGSLKAFSLIVMGVRKLSRTVNVDFS